MNAGHPNQHSRVEHCKVFIQKWQILVRGKAAQGFSPQAQTRGERRIGPKDAIYGWTLINITNRMPCQYASLLGYACGLGNERAYDGSPFEAKLCVIDRRLSGSYDERAIEGRPRSHAHDRSSPPCAE
jgi:hypothetical protein